MSLLGVVTCTLCYMFTFSFGFSMTFLFFTYFLLAKFGVSANFNIAMTANSQLFPTLFAATAMGVCNFSARFVSAFSYPISALEEPIPMVIFTILQGISLIAVFFLRIDQKHQLP